MNEHRRARGEGLGTKHGQATTDRMGLFARAVAARNLQERLHSIERLAADSTYAQQLLDVAEDAIVIRESCLTAKFVAKRNDGCSPSSADARQRRQVRFGRAVGVDPKSIFLDRRGCRLTQYDGK